MALLVTIVFYRRMIRPPLRDEATPKDVASWPTFLGAVSLMIYAAVVGLVHAHALGISTTKFERLSKPVEQAYQTDSARLLRFVNADERTLNRLKLSDPHDLQVFLKSGSQLDQLGRRAIADLRALQALRAPAPTDFPRWFSNLRDVLGLSAQILAALIIALVFSRRRSDDRNVDAVLRPAALFALVGLAAALVGAAPSLPANVQALLLGFVIAGLVTSATTVGLVAADLV